MKKLMCFLSIFIAIGAQGKFCNSRVKRRAKIKCTEFGSYLKMCRETQIGKKNFYSVKCKEPNFGKTINFKLNDQFEVLSEAY